MNRMVLFPTLNASDFAEVSAAIDAVEKGKKPDSGILQRISLELDRWTEKGSQRLSADCDEPTRMLVKEALMTKPVPWLTCPRKGPITDQQLQCDFVRSLRKKLRSIEKLRRPEREALRGIFLFFSEKLPTCEPSSN